MKLITEEVQKVKFITEGKGANKKMYIEGVFLQGCLLYTSDAADD